MSLRCRIARRRFVSFLEGGLGKRQTARLETHLAGCARCAGLMEKVRAGHEAARRFGRLRPDLPARLPELDRAAAGRSARTLSPALAAGALLAAAVMIVVLAGRQTGAGGPAPAPAAAGFARTAIREFPQSSRSRVVTEGFVREVYYDDEERTLHIKLAEAPAGPGPFVICEVRDSSRLTIPEKGSRIRVYGRARFDAQPGRGWHEVNPVMEIAVLNR
jgi:anti-sigma factor RsiW